MRILHLYKDYFPVLGGIENHVRDLARMQVRRGHDVTVLVTGPAAQAVEEDDAGVRVIKVPRMAVVASTPLSIEFYDHVRRLESDVTHVHVPYPVAETAQRFLGRTGRVVLTYHSDVVRQRGLLTLYAPILRHVLSRADAIIATSAPYVRSSPFLRPVADKTVVVPLGIDPARFRAPDADAVARLRAHLGGRDAVLFVSVGRLRYYKGLDVAIRALATVPGARLVLVGSGPMEAAWRALAVEAGVADRVVFAGEIGDDELPLWFAAGDVYLSSASHRSEAFGISILEGMASGRAVISTELGTGTSFINRHGVSGLVVPAGEVAALAGAMATLRDDAVLRRSLGEAGRARVEREFTLERMTDRVLEVYAGRTPDPVDPAT
jgi:rhamnosyl/mannosyltransferase